MKRFAVVMIAAAALAFTATTASAKPRAEKRQVKQRARIAQGVKSGELTRKEACTLKKQQRKINRTKKKMRADGKVTPRERIRLEKMQDRASKRIYKEKHDRQSR